MAASVLDKLLAAALNAITRVYYAGSELTNRAVIEFAGSGVTVSDNAGAARTVVTIAGVPGSMNTTPPETVGTSNASGNSSDPAHRNHVHAHGDHLGGTLHAAATSDIAGFMSPAHVGALDQASALATALNAAKTIARVAGDPSTVADLNLATVAHNAMGTRTIDPDSATPAADIEAAFAAGYHVELIGGATYTLEKRIDLVDGLRLFCSSRVLATLQSGFTNAAGADSDAGYIFRARSVIGSQAGVHHSTGYDGGRYVVWSFNPTPGATYQIATGDGSIGALTGHADQQLVAGDFVRELVTVVSATSIGGGDYRVLLDRPLVGNHFGHASTTPTSKVYAVTTVFNAVTLENLYFDFAGTTHAVGVFCDSIRRADLVNVHFSGFSRSGFHATDGTVVRITATHRGGTNCAIRLQSCVGSVSLDSVPGGARSHASGVPRGLITLRGNVSHLDIHNSNIAHGCTAISLWGGSGLIRIRDSVLYDCDPTDRAARDPLLMLSPVGAKIQVAGGLDFNGFSTGVSGTLKGYDVVCDNVDVIHCGGIPASTAEDWPSILLVDCHGFFAGRIGIHASAASNGGLAASPNFLPVVLGMMLDDAFECYIEQLDCFGVHMPIQFSGNGATTTCIGRLNIHNRDGYTSVNTWLMSLEDPSGTLRIGEVNVYDPYTGFMGRSQHSGTPVAAMMHSVWIGRIVHVTTGLAIQNLRFYKATAGGATGQRWEAYSNSGVRSIRAPTTTYQGDKVITYLPYGRAGSSFLTNDWVLCGEGPEIIIASSEDPLLGAIMVAGTTTDIIEHVAGAPYAPVGTVTRRKAGGVIGAMRVAPSVAASAAKTASTTVLRDTSGGAAFATLTCDDLLFPAGETTPSISQTVAASGAGANLAIKAQAGAAGSADGWVVVGQDNGATDQSGGFRVELGQVGPVVGQSGRLTLAKSNTDWLAMYLRSGFMAFIAAESTNHLYMGSQYFVAIAIDPTNSQFPATTWDQSTSAIASVSSAWRAKTGASNGGAVSHLEVAHVGAARHVVGLCVGANLDTTKMPSNSGSGVIFIGNCTTAPTASSNNTGVICYADSGALYCRETNGVIDQISYIDDSLKRTIKGFGRVTTTSGTTTTITTIRAALMPGKGIGIAFVRVWGYDTSDDSVSGDGVIKLTIKSVSGTLTIERSEAIGTLSFGGGTLSADVSTDVRIRIAAKDTHNTRWTATVDMHYVEH